MEELHWCDECEAFKPAGSVKWCADPYDSDVHNEINMKHMCDDCYEICLTEI